MTTLIVGARGNMGAKYVAILRYLKEPYLLADLGDLWWEWDFDRVIIATPTYRHFQDIRLAIIKGRPILCEKPIDKDPIAVMSLADEAQRRGVDVRMVSNWRFAVNRALERVGEIAVMTEMEIEYRYYNSGNDGFFYDCIQPIMMAGRFKYDNLAPVFDCKVNGNPVTLDDFSHSYPMMISEWMHGDRRKLWSLTDAVKATEKVRAAMRLDLNPVSGAVHFTGSMA